MVGLNSNHVGTNSALAHVLVLSAKVRRIEWLNEQLWHILDIGDMFGPTFGFTIISI
jgi:hypothetical protein